MTVLGIASALLLIAAGPSRLDDAIDLAQAGKLKEARELFQTVIPDLRSSGDQRALATALTAASRVSVSLGDYRSAIQEAGEAIQVRNRIKDPSGAGEDSNTLGLAKVGGRLAQGKSRPGILRASGKDDPLSVPELW